MATICGKINASIAKSCVTPLQGGTEDRAWIINKADIASVSYEAGGEIVEDIVLNSGASAFYIDGKNNSIEPNSAMVDVGYFNMFDHTVTFKGFDISPNIKSQLNSAKDGKYVVIVENYFKGTAGNSAFEVYGLSTGLEFSEITRNANDEATQGAFHFVLTTKVNKESKLPNPLFVTSYAATKAVLEGLL
jgi:hypothetical protein